MVLSGNHSTTNLQQQQQNGLTKNGLIDNCGSSSSVSGSNGITTSQLDISGSGTQQRPNTVLRVIIDNMIYPVTLDVLQAVIKFFLKKYSFF